MLSAYLTGRDANRGDCAHPCRYSYRLVEEKRPGAYFPVVEDERGTYIFNSRDLCLLQRLPELVAVGIDSVKIEGRMKSTAYVGGVVRLYRAALDWIGARLAAGYDPGQVVLPPVFRREADKIGTRGWTENFFSGPPSSEDMIYDTMRERQSWVPVGIVRGVDPLVIETRNPLEPGETVEYLGRDPEPLVCRVAGMETEDGEPVHRANPGNRIVLHTDPVLEQAERHSILRKQHISHDTGL